MKIASQQPIPIVSRKNVKALKGDESLEAKQVKLKKAARDLESFFVLYMLQAMRGTIPKSDLLENGPGKDIYTALFDEELAKNIAGSSSSSLSEMLYNSLAGQLESSVNDKKNYVERTASAAAVNTNQPVTTAISTDETNSVAPKVSSGDEVAAAKSTTTSSNTIPEFQSLRPKVIADPVLETYGTAISEASREYHVDPRLIYSVIMAESSGQAEAVSPKGAKGLMQLADSTAAEMGVTDSLNPQQNIMGGTKYLRQLLNRYDGDLTLTLAAYNAGPGTVEKHNGVPPFSETKSYVKKVLGHLHSQRKR